MASHGQVLLVDDDEAVLQAYTRVLTRAGFEVSTALSGQLALELLRDGHYDAVATDVAMPNMNGIEFLRALRSKDADLPVLLLTGTLSAETAAQAIDLGIMKCLLKPVPVPLLIESVTRAVNVHRLGRLKREALTVMNANLGEASDRGTLERGFERALDSLWMAFQPIIEVGGKLFGYEALMRSREPMLPHPGAVLDAAERLGQLPRLGQRIRALSLAALEAAPGDFSLFINLHPDDLNDDTLYRTLAEHPASSKRLVLELTERASLDSIKGVSERIALLRGFGCRVAIDDLGAGYAGLSSFVQLEPEIVKLDMSLVRDVDKSPLKRKLVASMSSVCRDLGVLVVAEGIETLGERDVAAELGCGLAQGYRFGRPVPDFAVPVW